MRNVMKSHINKIVALMSVFAGVLAWFGCHYIYTTYSDKLSSPVMIGSLCAFLFAAVFLTVLLGSMVTESFNRESDLFVDFGHMDWNLFMNTIRISNPLKQPAISSLLMNPAP